MRICCISLPFENWHYFILAYLQWEFALSYLLLIIRSMLAIREHLPNSNRTQKAVTADLPHSGFQIHESIFLSLRVS